ncbi:DUF2252 family protein [Marinobacter persicus]|jgi:uncharacterized protein (DUF2252 family)|uniref:Uncharacterized protein (DUF2252 family) n=1 Tax=Marinobacter persicus TaxID=930118 RepID=A0A2S6G8X7_9GAMM|nr:DUF2252 family protein [Marinobacter persicus]PPK52753.1 uncharacterized protein (DUF2252 family) [Marinobacter persicus]PPK55701.1 uncharacterized protein (DUF2252 family) [Marinobacter persicus]PPK59264.1 uncharacterized protein (DUF2252 family) [Marinobacter persicus]
MIKDLTLHNRRHQVIRAIEKNNSSLANADRQQKYQLMAESPYRFFRGTSHLFWQDMFNDWRFSLFGGVPGSQTWIQGDAHVYNFGAFANHDGDVIYGLDDFDDAVVSDYQYDLWRLAVSLVLDTRENGRFDGDDCLDALEQLAEAYLAMATDYQDNDLDEEVHFTRKTADKPLKKFLKKVDKKKGRGKMLEKWTRLQKNGKRVFDTTLPKLRRLSPQGRKRFIEAFETYRAAREGVSSDFFQLKDVARRVSAGTGSLGTTRYYALIEGEEGDEGDDIILDIKEQVGPALLLAMSEEEREAYANAYPSEGERHAQAFHALAEHPDQYLGWLELDGKVFSVRERSPFKDDFDTGKLTKKSHLKKMAATWGEVLATEHKRASRGLNEEEPFLFEQTLQRLTFKREREFVQLIQAIAIHYGECVEQDYQNFVDAFLAPD